jgi:hypothetical protein
MSKELTVVGGMAPATVTQGFGTQTVASRGEMAASAMGAREQSMVQARFVCAMRNPRSVDQFRAYLLQECKRPAFAEKAMYARPVGRQLNKQTGEWEEVYAEGPSIRLVEAALAQYGNIEVTSQEVYDDQFSRIVTVRVLDLQSNVSCSAEISVPKTVEKKGKKDKRSGEWSPPEGRNVISERLNSYGDPTFLCIATDDEVLIKQAALVSKAIRTLGLRLLPPDVIADCVAQIRATVQAGEKAVDPAEAKKKTLDAFASIGVLPVDIERYLGHTVDRLAPAELKTLRVIYASIANGDATWESYIADSEGDPEAAAEDKKAKIAEAEATLAGAKAAKELAGKASTAQSAPSDAAELSEAEMRRLDAEAEKRAEAKQQTTRRPIDFGGSK